MDDRRPDRSSPGDVDNICTQLNFSAQYVLDRLDQAKDKFQTAMFYSMQPPRKTKKKELMMSSVGIRIQDLLTALTPTS